LPGLAEAWSVRVSGEAEYRRITHGFALAATPVLHAASPDIVFRFLEEARAALTDTLEAFPSASCW
jgi:hypothetical protein